MGSESYLETVYCHLLIINFPVSKRPYISGRICHIGIYEEGGKLQDVLQRAVSNL